ncbi:MAG: hypothetical protein A3I12_01945 [Gammaproteobacteria bacterium RIFCSPLOWO2_02_FULL_38_11]|nr:MAG: hypothetical protein A3B69_03370 [Gammaproteobacteria bacterium RIFCSPHIGHO2_02_FULL_38_33]OGT23351.1 MAG: hypothetical protein A2W47_03955 [Gammaproteobacteria bacterium RIFCSPHIGHO2_12_38_15]OGT66807.1 MAG: hypothetical protein A3I12_01945 [Gammaproteobacteria bacterium RIFCSPLOWO2_02_FULL_38_11]OGT75921.1 MAG: hypothetical protein A3G71_04325 [Gammaproteobacteria bacterium RIFCSPLOWO2_12_FULL_38_14]
MNAKKTWISNILFLTLAMLISPAQRSFAEDLKLDHGPIGFWKTIDDTSEQPRSIIKIWEQDGKLYGKIVKIFYREGESEHDLCLKCTGDNKNKPILGLMILQGFTENEGIWKNGTILDPESGNVYKAKLAVKEQSQALDVRGYIGMPLLGRTQTWVRIEDSLS